MLNELLFGPGFSGSKGVVRENLVKVQAQAVREGLQSDIPVGFQVQVLFPPFHEGWYELGMKIHLFWDSDMPMFDSHGCGWFVASRDF